jgi:hypothetical protein
MEEEGEIVDCVTRLKPGMLQTTTILVRSGSGCIETCAKGSRGAGWGMGVQETLRPGLDSHG